MSTRERDNQEDESQTGDLWLLEQTCPDCGAWGTSHTFDDDGEDVLVRPERWPAAAESLKDICEVALAEVKYRLRNVYTGETVPEEIVLKSLGYEMVLDAPTRGDPT